MSVVNREANSLTGHRVQRRCRRSGSPRYTARPLPSGAAAYHSFLFVSPNSRPTDHPRCACSRFPSDSTADRVSPALLISSDCFAQFIDSLDLRGKQVIDVGTGSGILALAAARAGAQKVFAADINPNAALNAAENGRANGLGDRVTAVCTNLLSALAPRPLFDVILSSPPKHAGEPRNLADRGWHAGPAYRDIAALFDQARERLKPGGRLYVMVSSDSDLDLFSRLIVAAGFRARLAHEHSILIESLIIYELLAG